MSELPKVTPEQLVMKVSPAEFSRLQELANSASRTDFDEEMGRLRQKLGVPVGTSVRLEVVYG